MILDRLENARLYDGLGPRVAAALAYLGKTDFAALADGRYQLDGDRLVAIVQRYHGKPPAEAAWEAHRQYIDVQYLAAGAERIGYAPLTEALPVRTPYDAAKDIAFFDTTGQLLNLAAGQFAIFFPTDVHAPGLQASGQSGPAEVCKVVMKCRLEP